MSKSPKTLYKFILLNFPAYRRKDGLLSVKALAKSVGCEEKLIELMLVQNFATQELIDTLIKNNPTQVSEDDFEPFRNLVHTLPSNIELTILVNSEGYERDDKLGLSYKKLSRHTGFCRQALYNMCSKGRISLSLAKTIAGLKNTDIAFRKIERFIRKAQQDII